MRWFPVAAMTPRDVSNTAMTFEVKDWLKPQSHLSHRIVESLFYSTKCKTIQFPSLVLDKEEQKKWILWGLSLRSVSHMLAAGGKERCDWPLCNVDSEVLCWTLLYPYMGFVELSDVGIIAGPRRDMLWPSRVLFCLWHPSSPWRRTLFG